VQPTMWLTGPLRKAYSCSRKVPQRWQRNERSHREYRRLWVVGGLATKQTGVVGFLMCQGKEIAFRVDPSVMAFIPVAAITACRGRRRICSMS